MIWYGNGFASVVVIGGICSLFKFTKETIFDTLAASVCSAALRTLARSLSVLGSAIDTRTTHLSQHTSSSIPVAIPAFGDMPIDVVFDGVVVEEEEPCALAVAAEAAALTRPRPVVAIP